MVKIDRNFTRLSPRTLRPFSSGKVLAMAHLSRRSFLKQSAAGVGALVTIAGTKSSARVIGANDTIRIGVAGLNGRGHSHTSEWLKMKNVQITYLIDPDKRTYAKHLDKLGDKGTPKCVQDV